jgi:hypothetical protein
MSLHAVPTRPDVNFYRSPGVDMKAAETAIITILAYLVDQRVLTEEKALAAFNNIALLQGTSQAHEVGIILSIWKDKLAWLLNRNKPTAA